MPAGRAGGSGRHCRRARRRRRVPRSEQDDDDLHGSGLRRGAPLRLRALDPRPRRPPGRGARGPARGLRVDGVAPPERAQDGEEGSPMSSVSTVRITGVGAELPADVVTTAEVEERAGLRERFGLEPGWLEHMTGVQTRRWASPEVQPSELAAAAGEKALARAGLDPLEVDTLIFAGITRDCLEPATANL